MATSENLILMTDSYKVTHHLQYPPNTTNVFSYFESRGGKFEYTVFFGLQYFLKRYLEGEVITVDKMQKAKVFFEKHFDRADIFNEKGWRHIIKVRKYLSTDISLLYLYVETRREVTYPNPSCPRGTVHSLQERTIHGGEHRP